MKRIVVTSLFLISFFLLAGVGSVLAAPMAYIDPNTGGMLFQILAVMFATVSGFVFLFASRIKMMIARLKRSYREKGDEEMTQEMVQENSTQ